MKTPTSIDYEQLKRDIVEAVLRVFAERPEIVEKGFKITRAGKLAWNEAFVKTVVCEVVKSIADRQPTSASLEEALSVSSDDQADGHKYTATIGSGGAP